MSLKKLEQSVVSASNSLESGADKLQSSSEKLKKYLDDRKSSLSNFNNEILGEAQTYATDIFDSTTLLEYSDILNEIRANLDPRNKRSKTYDPNFDGGNSNSFSGDLSFNFFSTSDAYNPVFPTKTTTPISATKPPQWAIVLKLILPVSASAEDLARNKPSQMVLLVNPSSWNRTVSKVQQNVWTRSGIKTERWGEDLEQLQASGYIGGFYTVENGLNRLDRWQTANYTVFMKLVQFYKNNGCTYGKTYGSNQDFVPSSRNRVLDVGHIEIYYGGDVFKGNFESFSITEDEETPFSLKYDFTFNCSEVISIFDFNSVSSKSYQEVQDDSSIEYNENAHSTSVESSLKSSSMIETNPIFTTPNRITFEVPRDTLFPSLVSGIAKTDSTRPFILQTEGNPRSGIKVDFRSSEEASNFYANLPTDPDARITYVNDFIEKQKNRSNG